MSYKYYYFDDQTVGAEDLNKLVNLFVTDGVADNFENGTPYNISKLGEVIYSNATEGVVPETYDTLRVSTESGFIYIEPGVAFFKDGTVIEITAREQLSYPENTSVYVYLESDGLKNIAQPVVSESLPEGNIVPLAKISDSGEITDLRLFSKGKVPSFYASSAGLHIDRTTTIPLDESYLNEGKKLTLVPAGNSYRYLILIAKKPYADGSGYSWTGTLVYDKESDFYYNFSKPSVNRDNLDYTSFGSGSAFKVINCIFNYHYEMLGYLHFDNGETSLEMVKGPNAVRDDKRFSDYVFPFELTVIAI